MDQTQNPLREENGQWVVAKLESKASENGALVRVAVAREAIAIADAKLDDLDEAMRYVFAKIGLREYNLPTPEESALLGDHILQCYGRLTTAEIKLAFTMALGGDLGVDATSYENFSCLYFSKIMNAYRAWVKKEEEKKKKEDEAMAKKALKSLPPPLEPPKVDLSDVTMKDWLKTVICQIQNDRNYTSPLIPGMFYSWLKKKGLISLTREQQEEYTFRGIPIWRSILESYIKSESDVTEIKRLEAFDAAVKEGCIQGDDVINVKKQGLKLFLMEFLKNTIIDVDAIP